MKKQKALHPFNSAKKVATEWVISAV